MNIELRVFSVDQPGGTFYYAKVRSTDLVDRLSIRRRSSDHDGVQRDLTIKRIREISSYLETADAILPTPIVISVSGAELRNTAEGSMLVVQIPESGVWGEIIDGQHRYEGLRHTKNFDQYEIPVCVFIDLSIEDKAEVFATINSTQVKVPKSYIYDLFDYTDRNVPVKFCHDVCKALNYDETGPLYKRVKMLGKKLNDTEVLSQAGVVDSLVTLITRNEKLDERTAREGQSLNPDETLPLRQLYIKGDTVAFSKVATNFLQALRELSGDTWSNYVLRSIGIKVFMRVLGHLATYGVSQGDLSQNFFLEQLSKGRDAIINCSTADGTNKRAEDATVGKIVSALQESAANP